jgi:hypothetical protein
MIKFPKNKSLNYIKKFFIEKGLIDLVNLSNKPSLKVNQLRTKEIFKPELQDLYRLYQFIILNKRTTILEFGSGWSSLIFSIALADLKKKYYNNVKNLRRNNPFELFFLENQKKFLKISKNRITKFNRNNNIKNNNHYCFSDVKMTYYNGRISTEYNKLPLCNPDFIYLDGPDQFNIKGKINNISTAHKDMMPMTCDILKIEYFLTPGTIIIIDGRAANAKFLKDHFKRKWIYKNDKKFDQHIFYLNDPVLGKYNKLQLDFYKK